MPLPLLHYLPLRASQGCFGPIHPSTLSYWLASHPLIIELDRMTPLYRINTDPYIPYSIPSIDIHCSLQLNLQMVILWFCKSCHITKWIISSIPETADTMTLRCR